MSFLYSRRNNLTLQEDGCSSEYPPPPPLSNRWIGVRLDVISATTLLATALLAMATHASVSPALLALALTYTLQLTGSMQWWVHLSSLCPAPHAL